MCVVLHCSDSKFSIWGCRSCLLRMPTKKIRNYGSSATETEGYRVSRDKRTQCEMNGQRDRRTDRRTVDVPRWCDDCWTWLSWSRSSSMSWSRSMYLIASSITVNCQSQSLAIPFRVLYSIYRTALYTVHLIAVCSLRAVCTHRAPCSISTHTNPRTSSPAWRSGNVVGRINEVTPRRARLVPRWVTVFGG